MGRSLPYLLAVAVGLAGTLSLASCGKEDAQLLPAETAREITANLDAVQRLADEGDCIGAESAALQVGEQIEGLREVDSRLKLALEEGADRLNEVVARCEEEASEPVERVPPETEEPEAKPLSEKEQKEREKEEEKAEKEREKEEKEREKEEEKASPVPPPTEPPGLEKKDEGEGEEAEAEPPSGGVSPGSATEGEG